MSKNATQRHEEKLAQGSWNLAEDTHTTTGAYARARSFVEQDEADKFLQCFGDTHLAYCGDIEEMSLDAYGQSQCFAESTDDYEGSFVKLARKCMEAFNFNTAFEPHVLALVEKMDPFGFLSESASQIAQEFNDAHQTEIVLEVLEDARRKLRNEGPIFGMCSMHSREYRHHLVGALIDQPNRESVLPRSHFKRFEYIKRMMSEGRFSLDDLYDLSKDLAELENMPRQLTASRVKKIMGCDDARAVSLHQAYGLLPISPIV